MLIYTENITPRLEYTIEFIFKSVLNTDYIITNDRNLFIESSTKSKLSYAKDNLGGVHIYPVELLFETKIKEQKITVGTHFGFPTLFENKLGDWGFDVFSACFYLLSRYEEYLPHKKDELGRFKHENSVAYKENFLDLPIINIWCKKLADNLNITFENNYKPIVTFDIDSSFAFLGKGIGRFFLSTLKEAASFNFKNLKLRFQSISDNKKDPFNTFDYILEKLVQNNIKNVCFFVLNGNYSKYDKNLSLKSKLQQETINKCASYDIGIHPSFASNNNCSSVKKELTSLEKVLGKSILKSRQHYLKLNFPETYKCLLKAGIKEDYSMGYPNTIGFRASTCTPFYWFNLLDNTTTDLKIFPLSIMDVTLKNYLKLSPEKAIGKIKSEVDLYKSHQGTFVLLWHNSSFAKNEGWENWDKVFEEALNYCHE